MIRVKIISETDSFLFERTLNLFLQKLNKDGIDDNSIVIKYTFKHNFYVAVIEY